VTTVPSRLDVSDAAVTHLAAAGLSVGQGQAPTEADPPYVVAYEGGGPALTGPVAAPYADSVPRLVLHSVGRSQQEALATADKARLRMLAFPLAVPGRVVQRVDLESAASPLRDDDVSPPLWDAVDIYLIYTTAP
jgi:hypothetical protein